MSSYATYVYYLRRPDTRPNPFRIGPNRVFVNGRLELLLPDDKLSSADRFMANYNATREVPDWVKGDGNGSVQVQDDREEDETGLDEENGGPSDEETDESGDDDEANDGSEGVSAESGDAEGSKVDPVKRRTKAETQAGLTVTQAAEFRASGYDDPAEWFKVNYPEEAALADLA